MRYYPNYHILPTILLWGGIYSILITVLGILFGFAALVMKILFGYLIFSIDLIWISYVVGIIIILSLILYKRLFVKYIDLNITDNFLVIKHYSHRQLPDLKIYLKEILLIKITQTKQEKTYEIILRNNKTLKIDLSAITDNDLIDFSYIYDFKVEVNVIAD
jgi:hypothetical protein